jgi:chloramphenicol 3-O phosphotransferase
MAAHVVLLNGTSSSGKSAIAGWLQNLGPHPYLVTGFDQPMQSLPFSINRMSNEGDQPTDLEWAEWVMSRSGTGISELRLGSLARATLGAMHRYAADLVRSGVNVVLDDLLIDDDIQKQVVDALAGLDVWLVGVRCPLAVVVERETARGDRMVGLAKSQFSSIHQDVPYDVEVDTSQATAQACAEEILREIGSGRLPTAFARLPA